MKLFQMILSPNSRFEWLTPIHCCDPSIRSWEDLPELFGVRTLADFLGIAQALAYELVRRKDFPSLRVGKRILVSKDGLREWIRQQYDE